MARRAPDYVSGEGALVAAAPGLYGSGSRQRANMVQQAYTEYAWILNLVADDPTMRVFFDWIVRKFQENANREFPLEQPFTQSEFDREFEKTDFRKRYTAYEAQRRMEAADPRLQKDFEFRRETARNDIRGVAERIGVPLSDAELDQLTELSVFQGWDEPRIRQALEPILQRSLEAEGELDLIGQAGDAETQLMQWIRRNGLDLSRQALSKYISNIALGRQSLMDVQADIRRTYLAGMYPAWADKINEGFDPEELFEPYMNYAQRLLEIENIGLDDPIMRRITQAVGADGKPVQKPLWEFEQEIRRDPRWQQTDNAYELYTNVGTELLRMFGFR